LSVQVQFTDLAKAAEVQPLTKAVKSS